MTFYFPRGHLSYNYSNLSMFNSLNLLNLVIFQNAIVRLGVSRCFGSSSGSPDLSHAERRNTSGFGFPIRSLDLQQTSSLICMLQTLFLRIYVQFCVPINRPNYFLFPHIYSPSKRNPFYLLPLSNLVSSPPLLATFQLD